MSKQEHIHNLCFPYASYGRRANAMKACAVCALLV